MSIVKKETKDFYIQLNNKSFRNLHIKKNVNCKKRNYRFLYTIK